MLVDQDGKQYLDALAGLWNVLVGHGRRELADAAAKQMSTLAYASSYSGSTNRPAIELAERLDASCYPGIGRFFFTSGGAEANESAFKTARFFWKLQGKPDKTKIISRTFAYHGTTMAAMSATGLNAYWPMFEPRVPGFLHIESPYPYRFVGKKSSLDDARTPGQQAADLLEEAILREGADTVAAFIGEPVQGAGGVIVPPDDYWPRIRKICDRHQVLLIADEVITGFGRTGKPFGLMHYSAAEKLGQAPRHQTQTADAANSARSQSHFSSHFSAAYGIEPDIITLAKGLTSGYFPMGAMGVNEKIGAAIESASGPTTWMQAFTYSSHPVGCAVALANLALIESEGLYERGAKLGARLQRGLQTLASHPHVGEVRGLGTMAAVEFVADKTTKAEFPAEQQVGQRIHQAAQDRGMFTRLRGDVFNFAPCYIAADGQIDRMVNILGESIEAVLGN